MRKGLAGLVIGEVGDDRAESDANGCVVVAGADFSDVFAASSAIACRAWTNRNANEIDSTASEDAAIRMTCLHVRHGDSAEGTTGGNAGTHDPANAGGGARTAFLIVKVCHLTCG
jgi:hypothetical protein